MTVIRLKCPGLLVYNSVEFYFSNDLTIIDFQDL